MFLNSGIIIITFLLMEFVAWFTHKYVMHKWLWFLHRDHHQPGSGVFERNDTFFLIFAIPSACCYVAGLMYDSIALYIGIGISAYGLAYFLVHDIVIHQRFDMRTSWNNRYVQAIRRAHKMHHKHLEKEHGENFGMLIVPFKYWIDPNTNK